MKNSIARIPLTPLCGVLLLSLLVSACGGSNNTSSNSAASQTNSATSSKESATPSGSNGQGKLTKLKVGYDALSMDSVPINYTNQKGIFKKYGLDVELVYATGGSTLTQALVGGSFDIGENGYAPAAQAISAGADLVYVGGITNKLAFQFIVKPDITSAEQLKGKKIAISKFGSLTDTAATMALQSMGLKRSDAAILQTGGTAERGAALLSGQVDATLEQHPQTDVLLSKGYKVLKELKDVNEHYPNTAFVVTRSYAKEHKEELKKFFMALSEGISEYKKNRQEAIDMTAKYFKMDDLNSLGSTYDYYIKEIYPDIPEADLEGVKLVLKDLVSTKPEAAKLKAEDLVDSSVITQLKQDGFFEKLKSGK